MTSAEVAQYVGLLFGAWALGYGAGLVFYTVKRAFDLL